MATPMYNTPFGNPAPQPVTSGYSAGSANSHQQQADLWRRVDDEEANSPENIWKQQYSQYLKSIPNNPKQPDYLSVMNNGQLDPRYSLSAAPDVSFQSNLDALDNRLAGITVDRTGLNELRSRATATGPSQWANLMLQNQGLEQANATDELARQGNAGRAGAFSALATRGGASAGARERLAKSAMLGGLMGRQNLARAGEQARTGINIQDELNKLELLKALPGAEVAMASPELQKASMWSQLAGNENSLKTNLALANREYKTGVEKANLGTVLEDRKGQNQYNQSAWQILADQWKAAMQAGAQQWG